MCGATAKLPGDLFLRQPENALSDFKKCTAFQMFHLNIVGEW